MFDDVDNFNFSATIYYDVKQRISYRLSNAAPWDFGTWEPHPESPVQLTTTIGNYRVAEILSVNTTADFEG